MVIFKIFGVDSINKKLGTERIIILVSQKDTIFVDTYYNVGIKDKCYEISNEFKGFLEKLMPITIRENWQKHLPGVDLQGFFSFLWHYKLI